MGHNLIWLSLKTHNYEGRVFCPPKSEARDFLGLAATFSWFQTGRWRRVVRKRILPLFPLIAPSVWEFRAMTQAHLSRQIKQSIHKRLPNLKNTTTTLEFGAKHYLLKKKPAG